MAKSKSSDAKKITFGKRKKGSAQKSYNKHDHKSKTYRGQGK
jgi:hypothetical protein